MGYDDYGNDDAESSSSEDEATDEQPGFINSHVLVVIDCGASMFEERTPDFCMAIRAVCKAAENLIFDKRCYQRLAVLLHHPDKRERSLMQFKSEHFSESLERLQQLADSAPDVLSDKYCTARNMAFSYTHLIIECKQMLSQLNKKDNKYVFYISNHAEPCDQRELFQVQQELQEMEEMQMHWQLLPTQPDFDYQLCYQQLLQLPLNTRQPVYYNQQHITYRIDSAIKLKPFTRNHQLHLSPDPDSTSIIQCLENKYCKTAKLLPSIRLTRDLQNEVFPKRAEQGGDGSESQYGLSVIANAAPIKMSESEKNSLYECDVKHGLTVMHASKERYSTKGMFCSTPSLLRAHRSPASERAFHSLWASCSRGQYHLLCTHRPKALGKVHLVELSPVSVEESESQGETDCFFLMRAMPQASHLFAPAAPPPLPTNVVQDQSAWDGVLEDARLPAYDMAAMLPYKYTQQQRYFLKELFGPQYQYTGNAAQYLDTSHLKQKPHLLELQRLYPTAAAATAGKRKRAPNKRMP